ncbi:Sec-independent protein translocase subunit TatA [Microbacterium sp. C5A9]|uniref:Sec-independent protein translocase subunit TatA n=1 Tax=Microbacterium sp. C5A9 TaxID=2736663 RepID=UPI001F51D495|nr:Sec-independent protein translocase subunit TatA [Microbacterium sp. C5A9]MCI1018041.1 Sec-independent protein translocase subunit TatA [Microbacterium sp. C5A9]
MGAFGWPHLLIILAVILLLFGAAKLPALAKSLGQSARVFKGEMKAMKNDDASDETNKDAAVPQQSVAPETTVTARDSDPGQPPRSA